jgi:hypothetical protein
MPPPTWDFTTVAGASGYPFAEPKAFRSMSDLAGWICSIDDNGDAVDPPGVGGASPGGASATATISGGGAVNGFTGLSGGSGYVTVPTVTLTGGGGFGARARATISTGAVASLVVVDGGSGYTSGPVVSFSGGGAVQIGFFEQRTASTGYLHWDPPTPGEGTSEFSAGDVAQYQGYQAYQQTTGSFSTNTDNPTAPYVDKATWTGTCGASPPNAAYAGKTLLSSDPANNNYLLYDTTEVASDGTGIPTIAGPLTVTAYANTSSVVSQITVNANWYNYWYTSSTAATTFTGSSTAGTTSSLTDAGATFPLEAWGAPMTVTPSGSTVPQVVTINGVSANRHVLNFTPTIGMSVGVGGTYAFQVQLNSILIKLEGTATGGGATSLVDSARIGDPFFAAGWLDAVAGQIVTVLHPSTGAQTLAKYRITAADNTTGTLTLGAVDGQSVASGDLWYIEVSQYNTNRWAKDWFTVTKADGSTVDVQAIANDRTTLVIDTAAGLTLPGVTGVTISADTFTPGDVLYRNGGNTRWLTSFGTTETRTDHATGHIPPRHPLLKENWPHTRSRTGLPQEFTLTTLDAWNLFYSTIITLIDILAAGTWTSRGEDNLVCWSNGTDNWPLEYVLSGETPAGLTWFTDINYAIRAMDTTGRNDADPDPPGILSSSSDSTPPYTIVQLSTSSAADFTNPDMTITTYSSVGSTDTAVASRKSMYYDGTYVSCLDAIGGVRARLYSKSRAWIYPDDGSLTLDCVSVFEDYPDHPDQIMTIELDAEGDLVDTSGNYKEWDAPTLASDGTWLSIKFSQALRHEPTIDPVGIGGTPSVFYVSGYRVNGDFALIDFSSVLGTNL